MTFTRQTYATALSLCLHGAALAYVWMLPPRAGGGPGPATAGHQLNASFLIEIPSADTALATPLEMPADLTADPSIPEPTSAGAVSPITAALAAPASEPELPAPAAAAHQPANTASAQRSTKTSKSRSANSAAAGANAAGGHGLSGQYQPPQYTYSPAPEYPAEARRQRVEGVTLLAVQVGRDGRPSSVAIKRSSGNAALDAAAVRTVKSWTFNPARIGESTIAASVEIPVRFKLARA